MWNLTKKEQPHGWSASWFDYCRDKPMMTFTSVSKLLASYKAWLGMKIMTLGFSSGFGHHLYILFLVIINENRMVLESLVMVSHFSHIWIFFLVETTKKGASLLCKVKLSGQTQLFGEDFLIHFGKIKEFADIWSAFCTCNVSAYIRKGSHH